MLIAHNNHVIGNIFRFEVDMVNPVFGREDEFGFWEFHLTLFFNLFFGFLFA